MLGHRSLILGCCALLMGATATAQADNLSNLVANGGFETGDLTGWTLVGNSAYTTVTGVNWGYDHANSGSDYAMLGSFGSQSFLQQDLSTTSGDSYTLSLQLASDGQMANEFSVAVGGVSLFDQTNLPAFDYTQFNFHFLATSDSTQLSLGSRNDPGYFLLDDVSVTGLSTFALDPEGGQTVVNVSSAPLPAPFWLASALMAAIAGAGVIRRRPVLA